MIEEIFAWIFAILAYLFLAAIGLGFYLAFVAINTFVITKTVLWVLA